MDAVKKKRSGAVFGVLQRVGRAFMLPIALLPIAGLLLGIGSSFTNQTTVDTYSLGWLLGEGTILNTVLTVMSETGNIIFANLPIIFAMGVALGMAENEKATATLSAAISFFVMHRTISTLLSLSGKLDGGMAEGTLANVVGIRSLEMGVFGGIIVGLGVAFLHNRFYKIKLPSVIGNIAPGVHGKTQIARGFVGLDAEEIRIKALGRKRIGVFALSEQGAYLFELFGKAFRVQFDRSACPQLLFVEL